MLDAFQARLPEYRYATFQVLPEVPGLPVPVELALKTASWDYRFDLGAVPHGTSILKYTLSGEGVLSCGGTLHRCPPGHVILVNHGKTGTSNATSASAGHWRFLHLVVRGHAELVDGLVANRGPVHSLPADLEALGVLRDLCMPGERLLILDPLEANRLVHRTLIAVAAWLSRPAEVRPRHRLVSRALQLMDRHLEPPQSIADLAAALRVTPEHLAHAFRDDLDRTPQECYRKMRIDRAKVLLETTDLPIGAIARRIGYDAMSFARSFRALAGVPPARWRQGRPSQR
jgi:AraC family transcriptional regulator of arabinose operon